MCVLGFVSMLDLPSNWYQQSAPRLHLHKRQNNVTQMLCFEVGSISPPIQRVLIAPEFTDTGVPPSNRYFQSFTQSYLLT